MRHRARLGSKSRGVVGGCPADSQKETQVVRKSSTLVLGFPQRDPLAETIVQILEALGVPVLVVGLDPRARDDSTHEERFRDALASLSGRPIVGGFSLGARAAAKLCPSGVARGLLCFGYPFHPPGSPKQRSGLEILMSANVPTRIIQGTRDSHGTRGEVTSYALPTSTEVLWVADGNHRFVPRGQPELQESERRVRLVAATERAVCALFGSEFQQK